MPAPTNYSSASSSADSLHVNIGSDISNTIGSETSWSSGKVETNPSGALTRNLDTTAQISDEDQNLDVHTKIEVWLGGLSIRSEQQSPPRHTHSYLSASSTTFATNQSSSRRLGKESGVTHQKAAATSQGSRQRHWGMERDTVAFETGGVVEEGLLGQLDASALSAEQNNSLRGVGAWDKVQMGQI